jgi:hypothetical protein
LAACGRPFLWDVIGQAAHPLEALKLLNLIGVQMRESMLLVIDAVINLALGILQV